MHVFILHKIVSKDYYDKFLKKDNEGICKVCGNPAKYKNITEGYREFCSTVCSYTDRNQSRRITQEIYETRVKEKNIEIDLSRAIFIDVTTKVTLGCHKLDKYGVEHGWYDQIPPDTFDGHGCPKCGTERGHKLQERSYEEMMILCKQSHPEDDLSLLKERVNSNEKISPICCKLDIFGDKHGTYDCYLNDYINKSIGCPKCYNERRGQTLLLSFEEYREKVREKFGDEEAAKVISYDGMGNKATYNCPEKFVDGTEHGHYEQRAGNHLYLSANCPICFKSKKSRLETEVYEFVLKYFIEAKDNLRNIIKPKELDVYIPSIKTAIEFDGLYWHSEAKMDKNEHLLKTELCEHLGIHLIQIFEDDWKNKRPIIESRLLNIFHKTPRKIYARQCYIKEVDQSTGKAFLETNHLQGYSSYRIGLGLYLKSNCVDTLVSLMTFSNRRVCLGKSTSEEGDFELSRFASILNCNVIGSFDRLFKNFIKTYNPLKIITYADRFWTANDHKNVYEKLGFKFDGTTKPNYYYIINGVRKHRFGFRKAKLVEEGYDPNITEKEIMDMRGILRIWNSGNLRYVWKA
jgi:hypothetical protein